MEFLKKLNEEYRLFHIDDENHSITEIPLEDILDQGEPEGDEPDEDEIDFSQFDQGDEDEFKPEPIPDEDGEAVEDPADLEDDAGNAYGFPDSNFDEPGEGEDAFQNPETRGEERVDPNLSGIQFGQDEDPESHENYDTKQYHYPSPEDDHLSSRSANNIAIDTDAYSLNDTGGDDQDQSDFDDTEDYSDILGDIDIGSYLAKYAGHGAGQGGEELPPDEDSMNQDDSLDQGEEGLEGDGQDGETGEDDPNFEGIIRTVQGAVLCYKRRNPNDNTFTELWAFTSGDDNSIKSDSEVRRAILAGTDINPSTGQSGSEGEETAETTTVGNVTFVKIDHLVN